MAIYHFSGQVISRSTGRSSVASAAYRSAERLLDERQEVFHNYEKKTQDILHKEVLKPDNAPDWVLNREKLWNAVEKTEKRKDAQLAREFNIALPREFSLEQNIELVREFVQKEFVDRGMVADVCIHEGKSHGGERQPHVHVMLTMREISEEGFGKKVREWNRKDLLLHFREAWANSANLHLAKAGLDININHRTLEAQGIDLQPQNKIGPKDARERYYENVSEHQEIARSNGEKLYLEPEMALQAITNQQSTFTHHDLARFINRHTVDKEQFVKVYEKVKACPEMVRLGVDERGLEKYTTKEMLTIEYGLSVMAKSQAREELHKVSESTISETLKGYSLTEEQKEAFNHVLGGDLACIVGFAGTGKSYMLKAAREAWEKAGYTVQGMTLSGIAAENLEEVSEIKSHTIASRLYAWDSNNCKLSSKDIVVIDEAGLVGSKDMFKIMDEVSDAKAKLVLVGDHEQLQPIQAGAAFRMIALQSGYAQLDDVKRQEVRWQREATFYLATGQTDKALEMYEKYNDVRSFETREKAMEAMVSGWKQDLLWNKEKSQIMMAYTRKDVEKLNMEARKVMQDMGFIKESAELQTERGKKMFAENERVYFLRNDKSLGVKNGTLGTIEKIDNQSLVIKTDKGLVSFSLEDYNHLEYGYATTVYKAQGVTVDSAHVLASPNYNRHATYVAMSRHKEEVKLYWAKDDFSSLNGLKSRMSRAGNKDVSLDYMDAALKCSKNRGIEADFGGLAKSLKENIKTQPEIADAIEARVAARNRERLRRPDVIAKEQQREKDLLNERKQHDREMKRELVDKEKAREDIKIVERNWGKKVSFQLEDGAQGIYFGIIGVGNERYGVIEHENRVTLVERKLCDHLDLCVPTIIKREEQQLGQFKVEMAQVTQPEVKHPVERKEALQTKSIELDRGSEITKESKAEKAPENKVEKEQQVKIRDFEMEM